MFAVTLAKDDLKFSSAHMTVFADGKKERLHGHNFQVALTVGVAEHSLGRMLDFASLKAAARTLCRAWDERLLLASLCPFLRILRRDEQEIEFDLCDRRYVVPADEVALVPVDNITSEALAQELAVRLAAALEPAMLALVRSIEVTVRETAGQGASFLWRPPG